MDVISIGAGFLFRCFVRCPQKKTHFDRHNRQYRGFLGLASNFHPCHRARVCYLLSVESASYPAHGKNDIILEIPFSQHTEPATIASLEERHQNRHNKYMMNPTRPGTIGSAPSNYYPAEYTEAMSYLFAELKTLLTNLGSGANFQVVCPRD